MAQTPKVIEVTKSFIPVDPRAFPENLVAMAREDYTDNRTPVIPYEGYNFLPTSYGYKSYFGTNSKVNIDALTSRIDRVFIMQLKTYKNIIIALCEDGIWTKAGDATGAWTKEASLVVPPIGFHYNWSVAVLDSVIYMYRQGEEKVYFIAAFNKLTDEKAPSVITDLIVTAVSLNSTTVPSGVYNVSVATRTEKGLSDPCTPISVTITNPDAPELRWTHVPGNTGYRVYFEKDGIVYYKDVDTTVATFNNKAYATLNGEATVIGALPDYSVPDIKFIAGKVGFFTPNFLNMKGQLGVFRARGRLGFWDSENSVSWSSLDDVEDFTPSIETLAGSAIFQDVLGRIATIKAHGEGFIIYATKSVVWVRQDAGATFQWDPLVILSESGIAYPDQVTVGIPDSTHFAYCTTGLYKIESGNQTLIIPEVTDYLKDSKNPVFLEMMEGRYLAFKLIDGLYVDGLTEFSDSLVPRLEYTFPDPLPSITNVISDVTLSSTGICSGLNNISEGLTDEQQADAEKDKPLDLPKKGKGVFTPIWTAYFSRDVGDPSTLQFGATPCPTTNFAGVEQNLSPIGPRGTIGDVGPKIEAQGTVWVDGHWTIERFIAVQMAIWEIGDKQREGWISAILNRSATDSRVTSDLTACTPTANTKSICSIGTYVKSGEKPKFDFSPCRFRIYRIITEAIKIQRVIALETTCSAPKRIYRLTDVAELYDSIGAVGQKACDLAASDPVVNPEGLLFQETASGNNIRCKGIHNGVYTEGLSAGRSYDTQLRYVQTESFNAYNEGTLEPISLLDSAHLLLTGWTYVGEDNVTYTFPAGACSAPTIPTTPDGNDPGNGPDLDNVIGDLDGSVCSKPFETVTIPAVQPEPIEWPKKDVIIPPGSFLLQNGSIGPVYPTYQGALVYDLHLKKWGKLKLRYKQLLDYSPINTSAGDTIPYETFGINAGAILSDGFIRVFDPNPNDSYIKWGKIGYYRLGMTATEEVRVHFRTPSSGSIEVEGSLNGRNPTAFMKKSFAYKNTSSAVLHASLSCRWFSIKVKGNYDIQYMEYRGHVTSRR